MAGGLAGLLLFHPGVAVAAVVILAIWAWLRARERRIPLWVWAGTAVIVLGGMVLFGLAIGSSTSAEGGFVGRIINWVRYTIRWDSLVVFDNSGWIQAIFSRVPKVFHLPLLIGYGMLQPVLPAAIGDIQGVWPMQAVGILRGLGWFVLLPFLVYAPFSLRRIEDKRERLAWLWLWAAMALWIIISSARGGGDQWDNPRYRATLLLFQAALAAQVFRIEMASHARGLIRLIEVEAVFVLCFSIWTYSRYNGDTAYLPLGGTFLTFLGLSLLILIGDWLWFRSKKLKSPDRIAS
jgi:peptidoglycan/LPS O-acetylase OafA/YrhL